MEKLHKKKPNIVPPTLSNLVNNDSLLGLDVITFLQISIDNLGYCKSQPYKYCPKDFPEHKICIFRIKTKCDINYPTTEILWLQIFSLDTCAQNYKGAPELLKVEDSSLRHFFENLLNICILERETGKTEKNKQLFCHLLTIFVKVLHVFMAFQAHSSEPNFQSENLAAQKN